MSSIKKDRYIDGKLLIAYPDDYTVLDIETTGLNPQNDYITEISAIKYRNNRRVDEFSSLVKPDFSIPYYITRLTGIDDAMVADAPSIDEVIISFMDFLADDIIAGYNVAFDLSFIAENLAGYYAKRLANDYVDVMKLAQNELPFLGRYKQTAVAEYFNIATAGAHRALVDCNICNGCYQKLKELAVADYHLPPQQRELVLAQSASSLKPLADKQIVLLGSFDSLYVKNVWEILTALGASVAQHVTDSADMVIVGTADSSVCDGADLQLAISMKNAGKNIYILKEDVFCQSLLAKGWMRVGR